jgi:hypothetical protein
MTLTQEPQPTTEDRRREFIDGKWVMSPKATGKHMLIVSRIGMIFGGPFDMGRGGLGVGGSSVVCRDCFIEIS